MHMPERRLRLLPTASLVVSCALMRELCVMTLGVSHPSRICESGATPEC